MNQVLNCREVAELMHTSPRTANRWLRSGLIPGAKVGRCWHVPLVPLIERLKGDDGQDALPPRRPGEEQRG